MNIIERNIPTLEYICKHDPLLHALWRKGRVLPADKNCLEVKVPVLIGDAIDSVHAQHGQWPEWLLRLHTMKGIEVARVTMGGLVVDGLYGPTVGTQSWSSILTNLVPNLVQSPLDSEYVGRLRCSEYVRERRFDLIIAGSDAYREFVKASGGPQSHLPRIQFGGAAVEFNYQLPDKLAYFLNTDLFTLHASIRAEPTGIEHLPYQYVFSGRLECSDPSCQSSGLVLEAL